MPLRNEAEEYGAPRRVVIVDDDDAIVETLEEVLAAEGYAVEGYTDPIRALERLRSAGLPDVVVLDCIMPIMDGRRFMEALAAEGASVPVVLVTALCDPGFYVDQEQMATRLINKPFDLDQLLETIADVVDHEARISTRCGRAALSSVAGA